jgi:flagellar biosynthesis/type III secretory pathway protein FliH
MPKYEKFIFQDLPKSAVVNLYNKQISSDPYKEEIINTVIAHHLNTIMTDDKENIHKELAKDEQDTQKIEIDIEQIKLDCYNKGLDDARAQYEPIINGLQADSSFAELLEQKISEISNKSDIDAQIAKLATQVITGIAKKIYLILPIDFEQILRLELLARLKKFYKEGQIRLIINPNRYDFCINILQSEHLAANLKENMRIIKDDQIGMDDCKLEWDNTCLEYNQDQLSTEIDSILEQLKSIT